MQLGFLSLIWKILCDSNEKFYSHVKYKVTELRILSKNSIYSPPSVLNYTFKPILLTSFNTILIRRTRITIL